MTNKTLIRQLCLLWQDRFDDFKRAVKNHEPPAEVAKKAERIIRIEKAITMTSYPQHTDVMQHQGLEPDDE